MESPQHLNIYLLCKCMKREYAEDLYYGGNLYFNRPNRWADMAKNGNVGQGDLYEGVFSNIDNDSIRSLRYDSERVAIEGRIYLRSRSIFYDWPCVSFYCAGDANRLCSGSPLTFDISKQYIEKFCADEYYNNVVYHNFSVITTPISNRLYFGKIFS